MCGTLPGQPLSSPEKALCGPWRNLRRTEARRRPGGSYAAHEPHHWLGAECLFSHGVGLATVGQSTSSQAFHVKHHRSQHTVFHVKQQPLLLRASPAMIGGHGSPRPHPTLAASSGFPCIRSRKSALCTAEHGREFAPIPERQHARRALTWPFRHSTGPRPLEAAGALWVTTGAQTPEPAGTESVASVHRSCSARSAWIWRYTRSPPMAASATRRSFFTARPRLSLT